MYLFSNGVSGHGRLVSERIDCYAEGRLVLLFDLVFAHTSGVVCCCGCGVWEWLIDGNWMHQQGLLWRGDVRVSFVVRQ